jgi:hypothetical protein
MFQRIAFLCLPCGLAILSGCPVDSNADVGGTETNVTTVSTSMSTASTVADSSSSTDAGSETNVGPVDFATDLLPIFTSTCTMDTAGGACHMPAGTWAFLDLTEGMAYMSLLDGDPTESILPYVTPEDTDKSYVLNKLKATTGMVPVMGSGVPMPQQPAGEDFVPLPASDIAKIEAWIEQGAPE